jgi:predicted dehydrogenase
MASAGALAFSASSYNRIMGANDKVRVGVVGFSDRFKFSLLPAFLQHHQELKFDITSLSDIWKYRREAGQAYLTQKMGHEVKAFRNNEELYQAKDVDAVIISTSDFQHALHAIEAVQANCDAYVEKPFAETMADNRAARKAIEGSGKIIQIGSQRRSGNTYHAAARIGKIITMPKAHEDKVLDLPDWRANNAVMHAPSF